ncbi:11061_t:CDS:2, partial [Paraglomus occultum]
MKDAVDKIIHDGVEEDVAFVEAQVADVLLQWICVIMLSTECFNW